MDVSVIMGISSFQPSVPVYRSWTVTRTAQVLTGATARRMDNAMNLRPIAAGSRRFVRVC